LLVAGEEEGEGRRMAEGGEEGNGMSDTTESPPHFMIQQSAYRGSRGAGRRRQLWG